MRAAFRWQSLLILRLKFRNALSKQLYKGSVMVFNYEYTDTFGGDANYSWCKRGKISLPDDISDLSLVRKVKKELDLSGISCKRSERCGIIELRPIGSCTVIFITPEY